MIITFGFLKRIVGDKLVPVSLKVPLSYDKENLKKVADMAKQAAKRFLK